MQLLWVSENVYIYVFKTTICLIPLKIHMDLDIYIYILSRENKTDLRLKTKIFVFFVQTDVEEQNPISRPLWYPHNIHRLADSTPMNKEIIV